MDEKMTMVKRAVIDLGTNTFNLLIANVTSDGFSILHNEKEGVSIGMGGINERKIAPDAFQRGILCLKKFHQKCMEYGVESINAFGTSAIRDASNSLDFLDAVLSSTGIQIEVINGEKEAEYIYKGVSWSYDFSDPAVIMDIGGGSTEFIFADKTGIQNMISLDIGLLRIFQEFTFGDPMSEKDIVTVKNWLDEKSGNYFDSKTSDILIGASGTFETFYEMIFNRPVPNKVALYELPIDRFTYVIQEILESSEAERDTDERIIPIRKKMAPIAAAKVLWILEKLQIKKVFLSTCSLKEGVLKFK